MNEIVGILQDVAKLVTGGSDEARAECRRMDAERERRATERAQGPALHPAAIIAVGNTEQPQERLMGLQSAFAKAVQLVVSVGQMRLKLPRLGVLRLRPW
jgi:hypothetical protein